MSTKNDATDFEDKMLVNQFFATLKDTYKEEPAVKENVKVYAHSQTEAKAVYTVVNTEYKIIKKTDATTKAGDVTLGIAVVNNYTKTDLDIKVDQPIPVIIMLLNLMVMDMVMVMMATQVVVL